MRHRVVREEKKRERKVSIIENKLYKEICQDMTNNFMTLENADDFVEENYDLLFDDSDTTNQHTRMVNLYKLCAKHHVTPITPDEAHLFMRRRLHWLSLREIKEIVEFSKDYNKISPYSKCVFFTSLVCQTANGERVAITTQQIKDMYGLDMYYVKEVASKLNDKDFELLKTILFGTQNLSGNPIRYYIDGYKLLCNLNLIESRL